MTTQTCPKCQQNKFSWYVSEVLPNITVWSCDACLLQIFEDEKDEEVCENCNEITKTFLQNQDEEFNWCSNCNTISNYKNKEEKEEE